MYCGQISGIVGSTSSLTCLPTQCPPKEPAVSVYLRVCSECQRHLEDRQVTAYKASLPADSVDVVSATWDKMQQQCDEFRALEQRVEAALPEVCQRRPFCSFGLFARSACLLVRRDEMVSTSWYQPLVFSWLIPGFYWRKNHTEKTRPIDRYSY